MAFCRFWCLLSLTPQPSMLVFYSVNTVPRTWRLTRHTDLIADGCIRSEVHGLFGGVLGLRSPRAAVKTVAGLGPRLKPPREEDPLPSSFQLRAELLSL